MSSVRKESQLAISTGPDRPMASALPEHARRSLHMCQCTLNLAIRDDYKRRRDKLEGYSVCPQVCATTALVSRAHSRHFQRRLKITILHNCRSCLHQLSPQQPGPVSTNLLQFSGSGCAEHGSCFQKRAQWFGVVPEDATGQHQ